MTNYKPKEDSLIAKGLDLYFEWANDLSMVFLRGLAFFGLFVLILLFLFWTCWSLWNLLWGRLAFVYGVWILAEFINWLGH